MKLLFLGLGIATYGLHFHEADKGTGGGLSADDRKTLLDGAQKAKELADQVPKDIKAVRDEIGKVQTENDELRKQLLEFQKAQLAMKSSIHRAARPGQVSDECARTLGAIALTLGVKCEKIAASKAEGLVKDILGVDIKTALSSSDIPLPVIYSGEVVELVSLYGAARKYGTVYPLGGSSVKLPMLSTDPTFGLIAGSATVTEKSPQTAWVTFAAEKFGGLVRLPHELDEDSIVAMGQFLARYAARNIARSEDYNFFVSTGAGSGVNGSVKGIAVSTIDNSKVVQQASTKTKTSDLTLANARAIRAVVDAPAIAMGAYYAHPSMEQAFCGLNTAGDKPYQANGANGATLDGFPIHWVDVLPVFSTSAQASKVFLLFGDMSFQYLGVRGGLRFDTSTEAAFATDEILVRALERFTLGLMATGAISGLQTAAS